MSQQRIGLLGGSFNPAHDGHFHVAQTAMTRLNLDWVWWIVARGNPLKSEHGDYQARLASARAKANHPRMIASDVEARFGLTYTCDTLAFLQKRHPGQRFVWLMGSDNLAGFHQWKNWQTIAESVPIAIVARPGARPGGSPFERRYATARQPEHNAGALAMRTAPAWVYLKAPLNPASSTRLRGQKN